MTTPQDPRGEPSGPHQPVPPGDFGWPSGYHGLPSPGNLPARQPSLRPTEVDISFWLWVISCVLGLLSLVYFVTDFDAIRDVALDEVRRQAQDGRNPIDEQQLRTVTNIALVFGLVLALGFAACQLILAFLMRQGRHWARIVLAVIGGLSLLYGLSVLGDTSADAALSLVSLLVLVGALATMFLPAANPWFRPHQRA